jgi:predicted dehydrogenase
MMTPQRDGVSPAAGRSRRAFLASTTGAAFSFSIIPGHARGGAGTLAPSERLSLAGIGVGGMGGGDIATVARLGANVVALCDVDEKQAAGTFRAFPAARRYKDFRAMLDKEAKHIDAVTVSTPDHVHAVATMAALRAGKHVYTQKPLTHTIHEARELTKAAR